MVVVVVFFLSVFLRFFFRESTPLPFVFQNYFFVLFKSVLIMTTEKKMKLMKKRTLFYKKTDAEIKNTQI